MHHVAMQNAYFMRFSGQNGLEMQIRCGHLFSNFHLSLLTYAQNLGTGKKVRNIFVFICEYL